MDKPKKIVGVFCEQKVRSLNTLDKSSLRWKKSGRAWLLIGCPTGKYGKRGKKAGRCRTGTRVYVILRPVKKNQRCQTHQKRIKKG